MTKVRKFWRCFWLWKCSGLGVIAAMRAARRYHRRYLGL
jgi:hypothetical protein